MLWLNRVLIERRGGLRFNWFNRVQFEKVLPGEIESLPSARRPAPSWIADASDEAQFAELKVTTYDAEIPLISKEAGLTAGILDIYAHLQSHAWQVEREHTLVRGFPVQFLAASGLTEEAVRAAERIDYKGVPAKVFRAEHIVAIAASLGRAKDKARIEKLLQQADLDKTYLADCCNGIN